MHPIRSPSGAALQGREADAEELIFRPDGRVLVTFEHSHRVSSFGNISTPSKPFYLATEHAFASLPGLSKSPENGGLEAATWHPQLGLIAIQEHALPHSALHPAWSYGVSKTRTFYYRGAAPYHPTGMTHAPNGDLITIERHFSKETGPVSRVVRIAVEPIKRAATEISGKSLGQFDGAISRDNFESITMGPEVGNRPTILLCSDDNYATHQRTLLLQMAL